MHLPVEYLCRGNRILKFLSIPCSFFINGPKKEKLVVTIHKKYKNKNDLIVKHWDLSNIRDDKLPSFVEYNIDREELFASDKIIVLGYSLLPFQEESFATGIKQYSNPPISNMQENEYNLCIDNFFNTKMHKEIRLNWLWQEFYEVCVPEYFKIEDIYENQREQVQYQDKQIWKIWLYWRKHLLDFKVSVAPELVLSVLYPKPKKKEITFIDTNYAFVPITSWSTSWHTSATTSTTDSATNSYYTNYPTIYLE